MNNKSKEFIKNTIILFIGKFATQFISLFLLPIYTRFLIKEDFGFVDLIQSYISLFVPILSLRIDSAIFRFLIDQRNNEQNTSKIITNSLLIMSFSLSITITVSIIMSLFFSIKYLPLIIINIIVMIISSVFLQFLRGLGKNKNYSIASIITALTTLLSNIILIVFLKKDASSIFISSILSNIICILFVGISLSLQKKIKYNNISKKVLKEMLKYSIPMIPNTLSWWIVNISDRTIISIFIGVSFNAIYSVSCKFSNILNSIYSVFNMSWQESASLHINDDDRNEFFSKTINEIFMLFSTISLLIISILPLVYTIIIGNDYFESYKYIPILLYANSWNVMIGLIGGIYIAKKKTKEIAATTIISAIINIVINILLIKRIGLFAACVSTLLSYFIISLYRYFDCQKYIKLKLDIKKILLFTIIYTLSSLFYIGKNTVLIIFNLIIVLFYSYHTNKKQIKDIIGYLMNFLKNKKKY